MYIPCIYHVYTVHQSDGFSSMAQHKPKTLVPDTQVAASRTKIFHMLWRNFQWVVPQLSNTILTLTSAVAGFLPEVGWRRTTWLPFFLEVVFFLTQFCPQNGQSGVTFSTFIEQPLGDFFLNQDIFQSFKTFGKPLLSPSSNHPSKLCALRDVYEGAPRFGCCQHLQTFAMATAEG